MTIRGEAPASEKAALCCTVFLIAISLWNHLHYGFNMLFLLLPLLLIGAYLVFDTFFPEEYFFGEEGLEIRQKIHKPVKIPYNGVFHLESTKRDSFFNLTERNIVRLYYSVSEKDRSVICRPVSVEPFVDAIRERCPAFRKEQEKRTQLEVFFSEHEDKNQRR